MAFPTFDYLGGGGGASMPAAAPQIPGTSMQIPEGLAPPPVAPGGGMAPPPGMPPMASPSDSLPNYSAVTQEDGSILLHRMNADGTLGPVVKIINAIKSPGALPSGSY